MIEGVCIGVGSGVDDYDGVVEGVRTDDHVFVGVRGRWFFSFFRQKRAYGVVR